MERRGVADILSIDERTAEVRLLGAAPGVTRAALPRGLLPCGVTLEAPGQLAEHTDQLILRRRNEGRRPDDLEDANAELADLSLLAAELTNLDIVPPLNFQEELAAQLRRQGAAPRQPTGAWPQRLYAHAVDRISFLVERWTMTPTRVRAAFACASVLLAVIVFNQAGQSPVVSAADVLMRSNEALAATVHPGELLYRRWRVQFTSWERPGATPVSEEREVEEWMDGADFDRVAGRSQTADGWLRAFASHRENGQVRSVAYSGSVQGGDPQAALNVEPTQQDYLRAADTFAPDASRLLHTYLRRHFIYMPIAGERRFNREILEGAAGGPMPRSVTVDDVVVESGKPAFAVRAVDPSRVQFLWRSGEPPHVQLAREEAISYIAKDSYLTIKSQRNTEYRSGRRSFELRTLEETRTYSGGPADTEPVRSQRAGRHPRQPAVGTRAS